MTWRRLASWTCTFALSIHVLTPFSAIAAPGLFTAVGAGVSRAPLDAMQFNVPGFGDLSEAVNIASGNVYMAFSGVSHNNLLGSKDEQLSKTIVGSGWNVLNRQRLQGFSPALTLTSAPSTFTVISGDGSSSTYTSVNAIPSTAPHWIQRYKSVMANVRLYLLNGESGKAFQASWLVLSRASTTVAHLYAPDGTRTTFNADGEYADFVQNLSQQYRSVSASAADPEGVAATSPKTELTYSNASQGLLSTIKDEWGRITRYTWDTGQAVTKIESAFPDNTLTKPAGRVIDLGYVTDGSDRLLDSVTFTASAGLSDPAATPTLKRVITFGYKRVLLSGVSRLLLNKVTKPAPGAGTKQVTYTYDYDDAGRVISYSSLDSSQLKSEPDTTYTYSSVQENPNLAIISADADGGVGGGLTYPNSLSGTYSAGLFANNRYVNFTAPRSGTFDLKLSAFAGEYQGWPKIAVLLNGSKFAEYEISQASPKSYNLGTVDVNQGDVIKVQLINYMSGPNAASSQYLTDSRSLYLKSLTFDPTFRSIANRVTVTQQNKRQIYYFDSDGQLTLDTQSDINPNNAGVGDRTLYHRYRYYPDGNIGLITQGYQVGSIYNDGRTVHYAYDAAGNQIRQAEYATLQNFDGTISVPLSVTLGGFESDGTKPGYVGIVQQGKTFSLTATVAGDPNRTGVRWSIAGAPITSTSTAVSLSGEPSYSSVENGKYTVTQKFSTPSTGTDQTLAIQATSVTDPLAKGILAVTIASPIAKIGFNLTGTPSNLGSQSLAAEKLIVAPNCMRRMRTSDRTWLDSGCATGLRIYPLIVYHDWAANATVPAGMAWSTQLTGDSVNATTTAGPVITGTHIPQFYDLKVPWLSSVLGTANTERTINFGAILGSYQVTLPLNIGFFSMRMTPTGVGAWNDFGDEFSSYYYTVEVFNSPDSTWYLNWSATASTILGGGCIQYGSSGGFWNGGKSTSTITASLAQNPSIKLSKQVIQYLKTTSADTGEKCKGLNTYPGGLEPSKTFGNQTGLTAQGTVGGGQVTQQLTTVSTASVPSQPGGATVAPQEILSSDYQPGATHYETVAYDASNRPTLRTQVAPDTFNAGGVLHDYKNVTDTITYTPHDVVTSAGQTFELPKTVQTVHAVGGVDQTTQTETYDTAGLLSSRILSWSNGTKYRKSTYTYWNSQTPASFTASVPQVTNGSYTGSRNKFAISQFGDQPFKVVRSDSAYPWGRDSREFAYDQFGHVISDTQSDVAVNLNSSDTGTVSIVLGTKGVQRAYDGFDNQIWEARQFNGSTVQEQGWTYDAAGALMLEWTGTSKRLTTYTYNQAGQLVSRQSGIGNGRIDSTAALSTIRDTTTYVSDDFGRVSDVKAQRPVAGTLDTTTFEYDTLDREVKRTLPDGSVVKTWYDPLGEQSRVEEPYGTRTWTRDTLGRVTEMTKTLSGGTRLTTTYVNDAYGRPVVEETSDASIGAAAEDRQTVRRYDSEGHEILTLAPVLRSVSDTNNPARWLTDTRRPSTVREYDALGRLTVSKQALYGMARAGTVSADTAVTTTEYDEWDRPITVTDPNGYVTQSNFDAADQPYKVSRQVWNGNESTGDSTKLGVDSGTRAISWTVGLDEDHPLITIDPTGARTEQRYSTAGDPTVSLSQQADGALIIRQALTYTDDGLVLSKWEPKTDLATGPTQFDPASPSTSFVATSTNTYSIGLLPASTSTPVNDAATATTSYAYSWNGKVSQQTLPDSSIQTFDYDYQGNQIKSVSPEGFTTTLTYNLDGQPLVKTEQARADTTTPDGLNVTDSAAGLASGFRTAFTYDAYGNLIRRDDRGLITDYIYNSMGKVIGESRPTYQAAPRADLVNGPYKYSAYRLDGQLMAETTFSYADGSRLQSAQTLTGGLDDTSVSSSHQTSGGLTITVSDKVGNPTAITRFTYVNDPAVSSRVTASSTILVNNGLGQRVKRTFTGDPGYAAQVRDPQTGAFSTLLGKPVTTYRTYWKYNLRGDLTDQWNEVDTDSGSGQKYNSFTYTYSPTGKQLTAARDLKVKLKRIPDGPRLTTDPVLAVSIGSVVSEFNARDLLKTTSVYDQAPTTISSWEEAKATPQRKTDYAYYPDGRRKTTSVTNADGTSGGTITTTYDSRGRTSTVFDSNGSSVPHFTRSQAVPDGARGFKVSRKVGKGSATTATTYSGATTTVTTTWASGCSISKSVTVTLAGLTAKETESDTCDAALPEDKVTWGVSTHTYTYSSRGLTTADEFIRPGRLDTGNETTTPRYPALKQTMRSSSFVYNSDNSLASKVTQNLNTTEAYSMRVEQPLLDCRPATQVEIDEGEAVYDDETGTWSVCVVSNKTTTVTKDIAAVSKVVTYTQSNTYSSDGNQLTDVVSRAEPITSDDPGDSLLTSSGGRSSDKAVHNIAYTTDAFGNRLSVAGGWKEDGFTKRYDADGKVAVFFKYEQARLRGSYSDFIYDPFGQETLTSDASYQHNANGYTVTRNYGATYYADGEPQMIRKREGIISDTTETTFLGWTLSGGFKDTYQQNDVIRDQTYTTADGIADIISWNAVVLFDGPVQNAPVVFDAPKVSVSKATGLNPEETKRPEQRSLPATNATNLDIQPPPSTPVTQPIRQDEGKVQPQSTVGQGQAAGTVATVGTIATKDAPVETKGPGAASAQAAGEGRVQTSATVELLPPQNVLPSAVQALDQQGTVAPTSGQSTQIATGALLDVKPPEQSAVPFLTPGVNDGLAPIKAPGQINNPAIPRISPVPGGFVVEKEGADGRYYITELISLEEYVRRLDATLAAQGLTDFADQSEAGREKAFGKVAHILAERNLKIAHSISKDAFSHVKIINKAFDQLSSEEKIMAHILLGFRLTLSSNDPQFINVTLKEIAETAQDYLTTSDKKITARDLQKSSMLDDLDRLNGSPTVWMTAFVSAIYGKSTNKILLAVMQNQREKQYNAMQKMETVGGAASLAGLLTGKFFARFFSAKKTLPCTGGKNSFSPDTLVRTLSGLVAISTLTIGTPALAFNEQTGQNGYYPITAVHRNQDPAITYLTLTDPDNNNELEFVETTPEHPFYVTERSDSAERPKPVGHEDLSSNWVGAGHLKIGDKIKQADGTIGVVESATTVQQTREMFNLTVSEAHTYYVGQDGWLVHNSGPCPISQRSYGLSGSGSYDKINGQGLYVLYDNNGVIRYVGRGDVPARLGQHSKTPGKSNLHQFIIAQNNLSAYEATGLEQFLITRGGGPRNFLINSRNEYTPQNFNASNFSVTSAPLIQEVMRIISRQGLVLPK